MSYKVKLIDTAAKILSEMYEIPITELTTVGKRTKIIMGARRMFMFYLNRHLGIKYAHMKKYIKGVNHATCIHHCNKMEFLLSMAEKKAYRIYSEEYKEFKLRMKEFDSGNAVILAMKEQMIELQAQINTYYKNNDKRI